MSTTALCRSHYCITITLKCLISVFLMPISQSTCSFCLVKDSTFLFHYWHLFTPGYTGTHWIVKIQGQKARASQLILSVMALVERIAKYSQVSKMCSSSRTVDTVPHLLFDCDSLEILRRQFLLFLSDLQLIPINSLCSPDVICCALSTRDGCEIFNNFCFEILKSRKLKWETDLAYMLKNNELSEITLAFYGLFL
jgi:hypothetical protein